MKFISSPTHEFLREKHKEKLKLIVLKEGKEFVSRLESCGNILFFLTFKTNHLFKGKPELHKDKPVITVTVKNVIIGTMHEEDFIELLL